jgi:E3 ubiquitin-protein ligase TRIP12
MAIIHGPQNVYNFDIVFMDFCEADHGYSITSKVVIWLFEVLCELQISEKRKFLSFVTGSPSLPIGGLQNLSPPLTIVRSAALSNSADMILPSVMTCANYLKIPEYSSKEILYNRLMMAIEEGQNSFHLS